jgi:hypothetical protein
MIRLAAREVGLAASLERFRVRKDMPIYHFNSDLHIGGDEAEKITVGQITLRAMG